MSTEIEEILAELREQKRKRIGDIMDECARRGIDLDFVKAFEWRIWLSPLGQAKSMVSARLYGQEESETKKFVNNLKATLEVFIEKRPNHEMRAEWEEGIRVMDEYVEPPEQRVGDVLDECVRRGCDRENIRRMETMAQLSANWLLEQRLDDRGTVRATDEQWVANLKELGTLFMVLIEKRPDNKRAGEWRAALKKLEDALAKYEAE